MTQVLPNQCRFSSVRIYGLALQPRRNRKGGPSGMTKSIIRSMTTERTRSEFLLSQLDQREDWRAVAMMERCEGLRVGQNGPAMLGATKQHYLGHDLKIDTASAGRRQGRTTIS